MVRRKRLTLTLSAVVALITLGSLSAYKDRLLAEYEFWKRFESIGFNAQAHPEYRHRQTGIIFVRIPGGTFVMGSPVEEVGRREDEVQREVALGPFLLAKYEVSQAEWTRVLPEEGSFYTHDDFPADSVNWNQARQFCDFAIPQSFEHRQTKHIGLLWVNFGEGQTQLIGKFTIKRALARIR